MKRVMAALLCVCLLLGASSCGGKASKTGKIGENVKTYFFDFTVQEVSRAQTLNGYTPEEGYELVLVQLTLCNTVDKEIPMYDMDFQIQWGEGEDDYGWPIHDADSVMYFPEEYTLDPGEVRLGYLVYEVPEGETEFSLAHLDCFDDDTTGDAYFVPFTLPAQA